MPMNDDTMIDHFDEMQESILFPSLDVDDFWEQDDFEVYNQNEADDYRDEFDYDYDGGDF